MNSFNVGLGAATVIFLLAVLFIRNSKSTKTKSRLALHELTKSVFREMRADPNANPLYTTLFMNEFVRHLNILYPFFGSKTSFMGTPRYSKMGDFEIESLTARFSTVFFSYALKENGISDETINNSAHSTYKAFTLKYIMENSTNARYGMFDYSLIQREAQNVFKEEGSPFLEHKNEMSRSVQVYYEKAKQVGYVREI